ncbi:coiled-coil domain-containing protein 63-like isoform X2 [Tachypleus tridentatus]
MHAVGAQSDVSIEAENEETAEAELARLQRQNRMLVCDHKTYSEEPRNILLKQRKIIEDLQKEKAELELKLQLVQSTKNVAKDKKYTEELKKLLEKQDNYKKEIEEEKLQLSNIDEQIRQVEQQIKHQQKLMLHVPKGQVQEVINQKRIWTLENRLNNSTKNFNEILAKNSNLRKEIEHLLMERSQFNTIHHRLSKKLSEGKKEIIGLIEKATYTYDQRDETQSKIQQLREKNEKEQFKYSTEIKELQRIVDSDRKLQSFMIQKGQERADKQSGDGCKTKKSSKDRGEKSPEETLEDYKEVFERIKLIANQDDINAVVQKFVEVEEENFAVFNYVNEVTNETERLQEQIRKIQDNIQELRGQEEGQCLQHHNRLRKLENQLERATKDASIAEERLTQCSKTLDQLKTGLKNLFVKTGCSDATLMVVLGGSEGITDNNVMQYLSIIESRVSELLLLLKFLELKKKEGEEGEKTQLPSSQSVTAITLPGIVPLSSSWYPSPPILGEEFDYDNTDLDGTEPLDEHYLKLRAASILDKNTSVEFIPHAQQRVMSSKGTNDSEKKKYYFKSNH